MVFYHKLKKLSYLYAYYISLVMMFYAIKVLF
jgi:hypothetical protein